MPGLPRFMGKTRRPARRPTTWRVLHSPTGASDCLFACVQGALQHAGHQDIAVKKLRRLAQQLSLDNRDTPIAGNG
eukprot:6092428-Amphidinium_carterae.1